MAEAAATRRKLPFPAIVSAAVALLVLAVALVYLNKPVDQSVKNGSATADAKAYLPNLALSDVKMQATENFMQQQVVEVQGNITNNGKRKLALIDVYCLFRGLSGAEIHRERLSVVRSGGGIPPLGPGESRVFRLPFDQLPQEWNQAMPGMIIAQIKFAE